jgi:hypothetical protein
LGVFGFFSFLEVIPSGTTQGCFHLTIQKSLACKQLEGTSDDVCNGLSLNKILDVVAWVDHQVELNKLLSSNNVSKEHIITILVAFLTKLLVEKNPVVQEEPSKVEKMKMSRSKPPKACNSKKLGKTHGVIELIKS